jgi:hypothetical protein
MLVIPVMNEAQIGRWRFEASPGKTTKGTLFEETNGGLAAWLKW